MLKIDNFDIQYKNELTETPNEFMDAEWNFINLKKIKRTKKNNKTDEN